jgi:hypothetical protein
MLDSSSSLIVDAATGIVGSYAGNDHSKQYEYALLLTGKAIDSVTVEKSRMC